MIVAWTVGVSSTELFIKWQNGAFNIINTIPHGKCFVRYLGNRWFVSEISTRSLRSLVRFLILQLVRKYRTRALSRSSEAEINMGEYVKNLLFCLVQTSTTSRMINNLAVWNIVLSLKFKIIFNHKAHLKCTNKMSAGNHSFIK